ncbi:bifunctional 3-(3-hydroxy-phenyl)propionate/3-hydroxycinnamic acid hydroxylase MhpA [Streptomyces parvus]|uniref:bifunctional 3-(3-hydroxy-phenyl)propionate/3-hydroxycinnamic acid hydroxylase MhpA n=1 Tax=Streptomyces parvus TaxID=66428 RepID=UPI0033D5E558
MRTTEIHPGDAARTVPVVIVGAGPVGVTAALLLARRGVRSILLERHRDIYPLPRAVAMDDEVRRILQAAGVHEEFAAVSRPGRGLRLLNAEHRVMAEFPREDRGIHGYPQATFFDQPDLERLLRGALARHPECELRGGVEVLAVEQDQPGSQPGRVRVRLRDASSGTEEYLWADAVLGCDGAGGLTREAIGATWEDLHFEENWTILDVRTDLPVRSWEGADQICDAHRPGTFMRIGEDRYRWEFRLRPDEEPDPRRIRELVAPWVTVPHDDDGFEVIRQARYTFRARIADRWRQDRIFLLGDAAHLTPPFVGQGLCSGLRDAHNLTWKLARVLRQGADEGLLDTYESERKPHTRHMIRLAITMGWAMTGGQDRAASARRNALGAALRIPGLAPRVARNGHGPALTSGPLTGRGLLSGRRLGGTLVPQPWVTTAAGARVRLDDVLGDSFAVLALPSLAPSTRAAAQALGAPVVVLGASDPAPGETSVTDDGTLAAWLRSDRADAVLLRPDRIVMSTAPAGGGFTGASAWAPLLRTARRPAPDHQHPPFTSPRSSRP